MDFLKKNMVPIVVGVLLLVGLYVYVSYFSGPSSSPSLTASDANTTLSQNLLTTLQSLHTIKLDNSIFSEPSFQSLTDFGVVIPAQPVGRRNPFLPLAGASVSTGGITLPKLK